MPRFTFYFNGAVTAFCMLLCVYYAVGNAASLSDCIIIIILFKWFAVITESPVSVSVPIGTNAQFHCAGTGIFIIWEVDGLASFTPDIVSRGITSVYRTHSDTVQSNLTVPATSENNGTTVRCRLFPSTFSNTSTLTVLPGNFMCLSWPIPIVIVEYNASHN